MGRTTRWRQSWWAAVVNAPGAEPGPLHRWITQVGDVRRDAATAAAVRAFFQEQGVKHVVSSERIIGCPHEEGVDYLPSGNTALTRRATKHSPLRAVVVQWAYTRKRYERQGILVTADALRRAEEECLADEECRARQRERAAERRENEDHEYEAAIAVKLRAMYPGCPADEAARIAAWTCRRHSGRVGRSAAAKEFDPQALRLAVIAHIRHEHTRYDKLLMKYGDRQQAREMVRGDIDQVLMRWECPEKPA